KRGPPSSDGQPCGCRCRRLLAIPFYLPHLPFRYPTGGNRAAVAPRIAVDTRRTGAPPASMRLGAPPPSSEETAAGAPPALMRLGAPPPSSEQTGASA